MDFNNSFKTFPGHAPHKTYYSIANPNKIIPLTINRFSFFSTEKEQLFNRENKVIGIMISLITAETHQIE